MTAGPWWHLLAHPVRHHLEVGQLDVEVVGVAHSLVGPVDRGPQVDDAVFPPDPALVLEHIGTWPWAPSHDEVAGRIAERFDLPREAVAESTWGEHSDEERACAARHGIAL